MNALYLLLLFYLLVGVAVAAYICLRYVDEWHRVPGVVVFCAALWPVIVLGRDWR